MPRRPLLLLPPLLLPSTALAGMPSFNLSDLATLRLQTLSFFLLVLVLVALGVRALYNHLAREVPALPQLSVAQGFGVVVLWGLAFHLVLTMISGARELMTPGAWTRSGAVYTLTPAEQVARRDDAARQARISTLRTALWAWASTHEGRLPETGWEEGFPHQVWATTDPGGLPYAYVGGGKVDAGHTPVAWEPGVYGRERWVLYADGAIERHPVEQILAELGGSP